MSLLSVIVPTRNEEGNIALLVSRIRTALAGRQWEVVFVDDSDDATPERIRDLDDPRVRCVHRPAERRRDGLGGAVVEGFREARGSRIVVMDADLQHDPALITTLVDGLADSDVVIASRQLRAEDLRGARRVLFTVWGRRLALLAVPRLKTIEDPLSGFFAVRRSVVDGITLKPRGFKVLVDILARGRWTTAQEITHLLAGRHAGESKLSAREGARFLRQLAAVALRPPRAPSALVLSEDRQRVEPPLAHGLIRPAAVDSHQ